MSIEDAQARVINEASEKLSYMDEKLAECLVLLTSDQRKEIFGDFDEAN